MTKVKDKSRLFPLGTQQVWERLFAATEEINSWLKVAVASTCVLMQIVLTASSKQPAPLYLL